MLICAWVVCGATVPSESLILRLIELLISFRSLACQPPDREKAGGYVVKTALG